MKELELTINGVIHFVDYTIEGDGTLTIHSAVKDNSAWNCDPCEVTVGIYSAAAEKLSEEMEEAREAYEYELKMAKKAGRRHLHTFLNE